MFALFPDYCLFISFSKTPLHIVIQYKKVQAGKDQEKEQSEKDSHSKNRDGKNHTNNQVLTIKVIPNCSYAKLLSMDFGIN